MVGAVQLPGAVWGAGDLSAQVLGAQLLVWAMEGAGLNGILGRNYSLAAPKARLEQSGLVEGGNKMSIKVSPSPNPSVILQFHF